MKGLSNSLEAFWISLLNRWGNKTMITWNESENLLNKWFDRRKTTICHWKESRIWITNANSN